MLDTMHTKCLETISVIIQIEYIKIGFNKTVHEVLRLHPTTSYTD